MINNINKTNQGTKYGYARVSSNEQSRNSSLECQKEALMQQNINLNFDRNRKDFLNEENFYDKELLNKEELRSKNLFNPEFYKNYIAEVAKKHKEKTIKKSTDLN